MTISLLKNNHIPTKQEDIAILEEVIAKGEKAFYETGAALRTIREKKLYPLSHFKDFDTYCRERWDMTRRRANQLIQAAECRDRLTQNNCSQLPANEAQIRALTKLSPEKQAEVWQQITQENTDGKITAKKIKEAVEKIQKQDETTQRKILVTKEQKRIHQALSILSKYKSGKIRDAIFSHSGEALQMPQLMEKVLRNFQNVEL